MALTSEQINALSAKLDPTHVKQRAQAGRQLSYIEGWHAIAEANRIFGFDGWMRETVDTEIVWQGEVNGKSAVTYRCKVRVRVGDIVREGTGYGHGIDRTMGNAHESAGKEAETDAMKRAFMTFGNPFGLALYDRTQAGVGSDVHEPAPAPVDPAQEAADLIRLVGLCGTQRELEELTTTVSFADRSNALPDEHYKAVLRTYKARKAVLSHPDATAKVPVKETA